MASLLTGILLCLMAEQTLQDDGDNDKTAVPTFRPRSLNGKSIKSNSTYLTPWLDIWPEDTAVVYTTGVLSTRVVPFAYTLAMTVGIPANGYILAFLTARARSFSTAVLYLSLALSDLLLLLSLALRVHYHLSGNNWVFGEAACRVTTACFYGNIYCSAHAIACVSLKRYLAVARPFLYRRLPKRAWALGASLGVWALFGAAVVPELLVRQSFHLPRFGVTTCHDVLPLEEDTHSLLVPYRLALVCLGFLVPFMVCACAHVAVLHHLGRSGGDWTPFVRISTLVFLIFVVCFAPSSTIHIAHYMRLYYGGGDGLYPYYSAAVCLCCFHSCLDPFLCVLMCKTSAAKLCFVTLERKPQRATVVV